MNYNGEDIPGILNDKQILVGKLEIIYGPMKSKKSTNMIHTLCSFADSPARFDTPTVLYINSNIDTRSKKEWSTNGSGSIKPSNRIQCIKLGTLSELDVTPYEKIGVDEGQFFPDLVSSVLKWIKLGKHVIVCGLISDWKMQPFGYISELIPYSDKTTSRRAWCTRCLEQKGCYVKAAFTDKITPDDIIIDAGSNQYITVCRKHHHIWINKK